MRPPPNARPFQTAPQQDCPRTGIQAHDFSHSCATFSTWPDALRAFPSFWLFSHRQICPPRSPVKPAAQASYVPAESSHFLLNGLLLY
jgi:hypothetical protein